MDKKIYKISGREFVIIKLFLSNYSKKIHARKIARLLKKNHRTVQLALKRLEKLNFMES